LLLPLSYLPRAAQSLVIFTPSQAVALVGLLGILLAFFIWHVVAFTFTLPGVGKAAAVSSALSVANAIATTLAPWCWWPDQPHALGAFISGYWLLSRGVTDWLQLWIEDLLHWSASPVSIPYTFPWGEHFTFGGPWLAFQFHAVVAVPVWFIFFMGSWLGFVSLRRLTSA
jgi:hypothetical protein